MLEPGHYIHPCVKDVMNRNGASIKGRFIYDAVAFTSTSAPQSDVLKFWPG